MGKTHKLIATSSFIALTIISGACYGQKLIDHNLFVKSDHIGISIDTSIKRHNKSSTLIFEEGFSDQLRILVNKKVIRDTIFETNASIGAALPFVTINVEKLKEHDLILVEQIVKNKIISVLPVQVFKGYRTVLVNKQKHNNYSLEYTNRDLIFK